MLKYFHIFAAFTIKRLPKLKLSASSCLGSLNLCMLSKQHSLTQHSSGRSITVDTTALGNKTVDTNTKNAVFWGQRPHVF